MSGLDKLTGSIRKVPQPWHIICLILNIIFPGWGTILDSFLPGGLNVICLVIGLVQLFTCWLLIGWIWSIIWGVLIF